MRMTRTVLAAATLALCAGLPAHADPTTVYGRNTGDAGVVVVTAGPVTGQCAFEQANVPSAGTAALVVTAAATAAPRGAVRAVATFVRCQVSDRDTDEVLYDRTTATEGSATADAGVSLTGSSSWVVCVEARAFYADGVVVTTDGMHCLAPA